MELKAGTPIQHLNDALGTGTLTEMLLPGLMLQLTVLSAEIPKRGSMELKADTVLQILLPILTEEVHSENSDHGETELLQLLMLVSDRTMVRFSVTKIPSMVLDILSSQLFMKSNFTSISDLKLLLMEQLTPIATPLLSASVVHEIKFHLNFRFETATDGTTDADSNGVVD